MRSPEEGLPTLDFLFDIALDLARGLAASDRYERLLAAVERVVHCDAVALLGMDRGTLVPLATRGLVPELLGHRLQPADHPRLAAILESAEPVRFAADDPRPDPYDGRVQDTEGLDVHACMGATLRVEDEIVGVLTIDALAPDAFDTVDLQVFATLAALAAATMRTAGLLDRLERGVERCQKVSSQLAADALASLGGDLVGRSEAMSRLQGELRMVAPTPLAVLLTGETGVGKELVARTLHSLSDRAERPLVHVNCAALPASVAESELFGHVRGAFTGAVRDRCGKFELADHGTLFLDEVGELPLELQAKLLRALQEGELQRVGSDREIRVDVRVIAATNRDLTEEVEAGRFRADLFHRLSVYPIEVPPLRARGEDATLLAGHFAERQGRRMGLSGLLLSPAARATLLAYDWPGNVRELEHVVARAVLRVRREARDTPHPVIEPRHLALETAAPRPVAPAAAPSHGPDQPLPDLREAVDELQRTLIEEALERAGGRWSDAARLLGLDRSNLRRLAKRLDLESN